MVHFDNGAVCYDRDNSPLISNTTHTHTLYMYYVQNDSVCVVLVKEVFRFSLYKSLFPVIYTIVGLFIHSQAS